MNTFNGDFIDKSIPDLNDATIQVKISGVDSIMTVEKFAAEIVPAPEPTPVAPYKVFTALLTQPSGDYDTFYQSDGSLTIGQTYFINNNNVGADFLNVGAPNNNDGTFFIATGTTPTTWGTGTPEDTLSYFTGTPIVTILENTLGYLWLHYNGAGMFEINSNELFLVNKCQVFIPNSGLNNSDFALILTGINNENNFSIQTFDAPQAYANNILFYTPIEIRVYN